MRFSLAAFSGRTPIAEIAYPNQAGRWGRHLLFWLSLFPFATGWMGENHFAAAPTALYSVVLLMAAIAYYVLQLAIIRAQGPASILKKAVGRDWKGEVSPVLYVVAIAASVVSP